MSEAHHIQGLEALLRRPVAIGAAPVEAWDPPYCGDIGLAIAADGSWSYQGSPIGRASLVRLFASVLRRDADGRTYLVTPAEKIDVAVADAPFIAVEMQRDGAGAAQSLTFRTNTDDVVACGPDHPLRLTTDPQTGGFKPYVLVRGRLEALVTRALAFDLAEMITPGPSGNPDRLGIWSNGHWFELSPPD